jgi:hypothetical protein
MMKRKVMGEIFQVAFSPRGKSGLNCPMEQFPPKSKFLNVWQENIGSETCSDQTFFILLENSWNFDI